MTDYMHLMQITAWKRSLFSGKVINNVAKSGKKW